MSHVHTELDRTGRCRECGEQVITSFRGYSLPTPEQIERERSGLAKMGLGLDDRGQVFVVSQHLCNIRCRPILTMPCSWLR